MPGALCIVLFVSKTLETKKKILNILKKRDMTISGLSEELGLSTATVSQHMDELQAMGAIEKVDNEHFKKLKYYKAREEASPIMLKYVLGAIAILAVASIIILSSRPMLSSPPAIVQTTANSYVSITTTANQTNGTSNGVGITVPSTEGACPMLFYTINGSITGYNGISEYTVNATNGHRYSDYVIKNGSSANISAAEVISNVLNEPSGFTPAATRTAGQDRAKTAAAVSGEMSVADLTAKVRDSIVVISVMGRDGERSSLGAGFAVARDGLIATNLHVIGEARPIVVTTSDGRRFDSHRGLRHRSGDGSRGHPRRCQGPQAARARRFRFDQAGTRGRRDRQPARVRAQRRQRSRLRHPDHRRQTADPARHADRTGEQRRPAAGPPGPRPGPRDDEIGRQREPGIRRGGQRPQAALEKTEPGADGSLADDRRAR